MNLFRILFGKSHNGQTSPTHEQLREHRKRRKESLTQYKEKNVQEAKEHAKRIQTKK